MRIHPLILLTLFAVIKSTVQNGIRVTRYSFSSSDLKIARSQSQPSKRADASSNSNNQAGEAAVSWWFWGQTPNQLSNFVDLNNGRPVQLRIEDPIIPTVAGSMVLNSGSYFLNWTYYIGYDAADLTSQLSGQALVSLDPYNNGTSLVFAAISVPTTIQWWWYFGIDATAVNTNLNANNARLISAQPYSNGGGVLYAVIMISNAANPVSWQWGMGESLDSIFGTLSGALASGSPKQLLALAPNPSGGWDSITIPTEGVGWWWWTDLTPNEVTASTYAHSSYIINLQSYLNNGVRLYAGVELGSTPTPTSSPLPSPTSTPPTSSPSASATPPPSSSFQTPSAAAKRKARIIIGVVFSVVSVAAIVLVATYLYRRKRNQEGTEAILPAVNGGLPSPSSLASGTTSSPGPLNGGQQMVEGVLRPISYPTSSRHTYSNSASGSVAQPLPEL